MSPSVAGANARLRRPRHRGLRRAGGGVDGERRPRAADHIARLHGAAAGERRGPVVIVCGRGNNGGDGFVVARHLLARGIDAEALLIGEREHVAGDARLMLEALLGLGAPVRTLGADLGPLREALAGASLAVDALFGTGLSRPLEGAWLEVLAASTRPGVLASPSTSPRDRRQHRRRARRRGARRRHPHLRSPQGRVGAGGRAPPLRRGGGGEPGHPDGAILEEVGWPRTVIEETEVLESAGAPRARLPQVPRRQRAGGGRQRRKTGRRCSPPRACSAPAAAWRPSPAGPRPSTPSPRGCSR